MSEETPGKERFRVTLKNPDIETRRALRAMSDEFELDVVVVNDGKECSIGVKGKCGETDVPLADRSSIGEYLRGISCSRHEGEGARESPGPAPAHDPSRRKAEVPP